MTYIDFLFVLTELIFQQAIIYITNHLSNVYKQTNHLKMVNLPIF